MEIKTIKNATVVSDGRGYQKFTYVLTDGTTVKDSGAYDTLALAKKACADRVGQQVIVGGYVAHRFSGNSMTVHDNQAILVNERGCEAVKATKKEALDYLRAQEMEQIEQAYQNCLNDEEF